MTENTSKTSLYQTDSTRFGGLIYPSDFNPYQAGHNMANRIASDQRFDRYCHQNTEIRNRRMAERREQARQNDF